MSVTRRAMLGTAAAAIATPALAQSCQIGVPKHEKGPLVFMDYDQVELDIAYRQEYYEPLGRRVQGRLSATSGEVRRRIGEPLHHSYGETAVETLDIYRTDRANICLHPWRHVALRFGWGIRLSRRDVRQGWSPLSRH
ncbi:hypothetical protein [Dongia deserti]|uniref:hypothetical protein n=1 Tax=Dongia deserti TaxID=2268030 RepID=UPI0025489B45|nr:hypothetical protein [Dongia deserti]